ncbi:hypothetical protein [Sutterella sp.]|uniref:hypothetical protein n=1 Tax=Sutterella sp. TaxID=1981025 RepID=UPI0026E03A50|nr:hypothetical protein [Sutterella sp.]MDO5531230.1 hypothetical protein [Sutterella sp.]
MKEIPTDVLSLCRRYGFSAEGYQNTSADDETAELLASRPLFADALRVARDNLPTPGKGADKAEPEENGRGS